MTAPGSASVPPSSPAAGPSGGGASSGADASGIARAHRGLALLFLVLGVVAFFLAGLGAFGEGFDAHRMSGSLMLLLSLVLLILAVVGRRAALQASAVLFGLMILQSVLAVLGSEVSSVLGALHPVNGLLILFAASLAAAGKPVGVPRRA